MPPTFTLIGQACRPCAVKTQKIKLKKQLKMLCAVAVVMLCIDANSSY